jgi:aurora kinase
VKPLKIAPKVLDIGKYDGGLDLENDTGGEKVEGEAAKDLALDSSQSR